MSRRGGGMGVVDAGYEIAAADDANAVPGAEASRERKTKLTRKPMTDWTLLLSFPEAKSDSQRIQPATGIAAAVADSPPMRSPPPRADLHVRDYCFDSLLRSRSAPDPASSPVRHVRCSRLRIRRRLALASDFRPRSC